MSKETIWWYYRKQYYNTEDEALNALIRDYPNIGLAGLLHLAKSQILVVYEADIITEIADDKNIE